MKLELKQRAIQLRRDGKSYSEILSVIGPVSKGSLSNWLKPIKLTADQKNRILNNINNGREIGRQKGGWTNKKKREERIQAIQNRASMVFKKNMRHPLFLGGLLLYLAEGSKKMERFQFMNSDINLIKIMLEWIYIFENLKKNQIHARLYTHKIYYKKNYESFWSKNVCIPLKNFSKTIYKPSVHKVKKNPHYKGCLRIEVSGSELYWKIMKWRDMLYQNLL
ncbi:MAG: hypothetical protein A2826_02125 [Candidatus Doudnabacteria bacterium RIFCSPHIGHO2_01_FULL_43_23]|uniref:Uncharacterized protein n=1 Tax=Candidatus Doudnabacteria bacterium RIFCSPHIGHO2_01_FULL_43_23 TaxID=1817822 RepID=A0A1F5NUN9_9BACT|nr:MAG: hypothetical protein A2826_02125 [Candidatus Doudnabacteria bacterium RIFCSPHIGHO2_01_FULL_43_23]